MLYYIRLIDRGKIMSGFVKRLNEALSASSLSYSEIEEKLELAPGSVEAWAKGDGEPDTPTVNRLSELLGVSANYLLFGAKTMGEMKAMFPNDANPSPTPISDWRFLAGAIMIFVGAVGILMMVMRYAAKGAPVFELLLSLGAPVFVFAAIFACGIILCIVTCIVTLSTKKIRKKDRKNGK